MLKRRAVLFASLVLVALIVIPNARSLYEGIFFYLRDVITYAPQDVEPIKRAGRYGSIYNLVSMKNAERLVYLRQSLNRPGIRATEIPIPGSPFSNLLIQLNDTTEPRVIFSAHYDKLYDDPAYHGASDNTAAVSVLLAAIDELARRGDAGHRAFLFIGEEETGLHGASAFVEYARANNLSIRAIINFDNIGRGRLAIRPSATTPGFVFTIPLVGDFAYDGRELRASPAYPLANARLTQSLLRAQPDMIVYERFTAVSDSNVFQASGIDTVTISASDQYYLQQTWHSYVDRLELLDERNLDRAFDLIINSK